MYMEDIQNKKINKWRKIQNYDILERGISQKYSSPSKQSNKTRKNVSTVKTKTKTLFILMISSYPTYHNNKI